MPVFHLVEALVDDRLQHFRRAIALAVFLDHQGERIIFLDLAAAEHPADLEVLGLGRRADHDRALGEGQI